jgi:arginine/ornithine transport system permease protein
MQFDLVFQNWTLLAWGIWYTVHLTFLALLFGFCIALPCGLALARKVKWASPFIRGYVYAFRGTPLLVQVFLIYFGLAQFDFVRESWAWLFLREAWWCAVIAFALNSGAYATEILRGAFETTPLGETEAATALGLSKRQVNWLVMVPSSLRRALPQYGNEVVFMLHGSAVASIITIQDILGAARTINAKYYLAYEGFVSAAILYMILTYVLVRIFRYLENRYLKHLNLAPSKTDLTLLQAGI